MYTEQGWPVEQDAEIRKQRAERGWSDWDALDFDTFLADVIANGCRYLATRKASYPAYFETAAEWDAVLQEIIDGFAAHGHFYEHEYLTKDTFEEQNACYAAMRVKRDRAFDLMKEHFEGLWV